MPNLNLPADSHFDVESIKIWIEAGWLAPRPDGASHLSEIDLARARLIHDLKHALGVNDEGIPIVLDLLDQVHGLRRAMRELVTRTSV